MVHAERHEVYRDSADPTGAARRLPGHSERVQIVLQAGSDLQVLSLPPATGIQAIVALAARLRVSQRRHETRAAGPGPVDVATTPVSVAGVADPVRLDLQIPVGCPAEYN